MGIRQQNPDCYLPFLVPKKEEIGEQFHELMFPIHLLDQTGWREGHNFEWRQQSNVISAFLQVFWTAKNSPLKRLAFHRKDLLSVNFILILNGKIPNHYSSSIKPGKRALLEIQAFNADLCSVAAPSTNNHHYINMAPASGGGKSAPPAADLDRRQRNARRKDIQKKLDEWERGKNDR